MYAKLQLAYSYASGVVNWLGIHSGGGLRNEGVKSRPPGVDTQTLAFPHTPIRRPKVASLVRVWCAGGFEIHRIRENLGLGQERPSSHWPPSIKFRLSPSLQCEWRSLSARLVRLVRLARRRRRRPGFSGGADPGADARRCPRTFDAARRARGLGVRSPWSPTVILLFPVDVPSHSLSLSLSPLHPAPCTGHVDLLNPTSEAEAKTHKPAPRAEPQLVLHGRCCPGCTSISTVFSHAQTVIQCTSCMILLAQPTGGKARLTEGCSFRKKTDY